MICINRIQWKIARSQRSSRDPFPGTFLFMIPSLPRRSVLFSPRLLHWNAHKCFVMCRGSWPASQSINFTARERRSGRTDEPRLPWVLMWHWQRQRTCQVQRETLFFSGSSRLSYGKPLLVFFPFSSTKCTFLVGWMFFSSTSVPWWKVCQHFNMLCWLQTLSTLWFFSF